MHEQYMSIMHEQQINECGNRKWIQSMNNSYKYDAGCRMQCINNK